MAKDSIASNKAHQELTCAQAFVDWLDSSNGLSHKLRRAESVFGGRWDFVAQATDRGSWLGIEIKSLVLTDDRRQFSDWESFFTHVSKRLAPRDNGSYLVSVTIPWRFRQQQASDLVEPFIEALIELNLLEGQDGNLGPGIARRFSGWPTKPPASDQTLWTEQRILKTVSQPQDLTVVKDSDTGSSIEVGMSMGGKRLTSDGLSLSPCSAYSSLKRRATPNRTYSWLKRKQWVPQQLHFCLTATCLGDRTRCAWA